MKSKLIVLSKIALVFVVIGFFLPIIDVPIVGTVNGVRLISFLSEVGKSSQPFLFLLIPLFSLMSILFTFFLMHKGENLEKGSFVALDFIVTTIVSCIVFMSFAKFSKVFDMKELPFKELLSHVVGTGGYFVFFGIVAADFFLLLEILIVILSFMLEGSGDAVDEVIETYKKKFNVENANKFALYLLGIVLLLIGYFMPLKDEGYSMVGFVLNSVFEYGWYVEVFAALAIVASVIGLLVLSPLFTAKDAKVISIATTALSLFGGIIAFVSYGISGTALFIIVGWFLSIIGALKAKIE